MAKLKLQVTTAVGGPYIVDGIMASSSSRHVILVNILGEDIFIQTDIITFIAPIQEE